MKKIVAIGYFIFSFLIGTQAFAKAPTNFAALIGVWTNTNAATGSIVRIVIRPLGAGITVQPFGACSPTLCDHGIISARSFAASVGSAASIGFRASKSFGFKSTGYNGFRKGQLLYLTTQDTFAAGDNRFDYTVMETFSRTSAVVSDLVPNNEVFDHHATAADIE